MKSGIDGNSLFCFVALFSAHFFLLTVTLFDSLSHCCSTKERKENQFLSDKDKVCFMWITPGMMIIKCVVCKLKQCAQHTSAIVIHDACCDLMLSILCYPYKHQIESKNKTIYCHICPRRPLLGEIRGKQNISQQLSSTYNTFKRYTWFAF